MVHPNRAQHERDAARNRARYLPTWSRRWRAIRKAQLERFALCAHCGDVANEVDHIEGDTSKNLIGIDLQSLCKPCHSRKTAGMPIAGCDAQGVPADPDHPWNQAKKSLGTLAVESVAPPLLHR